MNTSVSLQKNLESSSEQSSCRLPTASQFTFTTSLTSSISTDSLCDPEPAIEKSIKEILEGSDNPPGKDSQEFVKWRQLVINLVGTYLLTK